MRIVLASKSPRRRELLEQMGIKKFEIVCSEADETVAPGLAPDEVVKTLSRRKAAAVAERVEPEDLIIAADTVVALDDLILGKPADAEAAKEMLHRLSGRTNEVYTGITVLRDGRSVTECERTAVRFRELSEKEICDYVATGEPMDKAGAYGIQGLGAMLISGIEGDYFNVMGLPVFRLNQILTGFGLDLLAEAAGETR